MVAARRVAVHRPELLEAAGVWSLADEGYVELAGRGAVTSFIERCRSLRLWTREATVDQT